MTPVIVNLPHNRPLCPFCGCLLDCEEKSFFASKQVVDDIDYYCNNPICHEQ